MYFGLDQQTDKLEFVEESRRIEQHCHSEPVRLSGVGISIEFQIIHRHTDRSILPFPGIHPWELVLLSGRLPRQRALLYRNDREVSSPPNSQFAYHRTIPSGSGKKRQHKSCARLGRPPCGQIPNLYLLNEADMHNKEIDN